MSDNPYQTPVQEIEGSAEAAARNRRIWYRVTLITGWTLIVAVGLVFAIAWTEAHLHGRPPPPSPDQPELDQRVKLVLQLVSLFGGILLAWLGHRGLRLERE